MEALILNRDFDAIALVDAFNSFIWTDRYNTYGDFEYYAPIDLQPVDAFQKNYYLYQKKSDRLMIIEDLNIKTDPEAGTYLTVTGRSLESILERRCVWYRTSIEGSLQDGIKKLIEENIINPVDAVRKMPNFRFKTSTDTRITSLTMEGDYLGETLYDIISGVCQLNDLGFRVTYDGTKYFDFELYYGEDRSYDQEKNPWVVFSPNYENLSDTSYFSSETTLKTAAVVIGSDSNEAGQAVIEVVGIEAEGLDRRETSVDASGISTPSDKINEDAVKERGKSKGWSDEQIQAQIEKEKAEALKQSTEDYFNQLKQAGEESLAETYVTESFEGEIDATRQYIYERDFFMGDIVQIRNEYGMEAHSRITEVIRCHDLNGETLTPTFTSII